MDESMQFVSDVYFENNGEIDLLTGAMAPERFNQILARDLQLADRNLAQTMDFIAIATNSAQVRRLTNSIQIAIERGTPILDVLNNQVQALNKQINISLLKKSGKSEITLLIPVVFLILPVSISFAIWPSIYGLNQAGF
jgi:pilus assembly protein TadC